MGKFDGILLVSDLDETLLTKDKRISDGNRAAIQRFTAEGGTFTYVTGRIPVGMQAVLDQMTPEVPVGCINGGGIYDPKTKTYVWSAKLDPAAEKLVDYVYREFPDVGIELCGYYEAWFLRMTPLTEEHRQIEGIPYVSATYQQVSDQLAKIVLIIEADRLETMATALQKHPLADQFDFVQSTSQYYEILPKGASKGTALLRIADLLGIDRRKTVAVGDNNNDLTMLKAAGFGVAVANATPYAKNAADLVLDRTNNEDAIAELIERLERELPF